MRFFRPDLNHLMILILMWAWLGFPPHLYLSDMVGFFSVIFQAGAVGGGGWPQSISWWVEDDLTHNWQNHRLALSQSSRGDQHSAENRAKGGFSHFRLKQLQLPRNCTLTISNPIGLQLFQCNCISADLGLLVYQAAKTHARLTKGS